MNHSLDDDDRQLALAAVVSEQVAIGRYPILLAARGKPTRASDSGWQFHSNSTGEDFSKGQVWMLREVFQFEPSLRAYLRAQVGTVLTRESSTHPWIVGHCAGDV